MVTPRSQTAVEDYLKVIFNLGEWDLEGCTNADVAASLGVSTSSASEMVRKLAEGGLVRHEPYRGIELTPEGRDRAVQMVRQHRLIETFLVQVLGYSWDEVHDEAEVLEHAVSPMLVGRIDDVLGSPWRDPHGDPIPTSEGLLHRPVARALAGLAPGEQGYVSRLVDHDPELLRWFSENGIGLDTQVVVTEQKPFGGPLVIAVQEAGKDASAIELGIQAVAAVWVSEHPPLADPDPGGCPYQECQHLEQAQGSRPAR